MKLWLSDLWHWVYRSKGYSWGEYRSDRIALRDWSEKNA